MPAVSVEKPLFFHSSPLPAKENFTPLTSIARFCVFGNAFPRVFHTFFTFFRLYSLLFSFFCAFSVYFGRISGGFQAKLRRRARKSAQANDTDFRPKRRYINLFLPFRTIFRRPNTLPKSDIFRFRKARARVLKSCFRPPPRA